MNLRKERTEEEYQVYGGINFMVGVTLGGTIMAAALPWWGCVIGGIIANVVVGVVMGIFRKIKIKIKIKE